MADDEEVVAEKIVKIPKKNTQRQKLKRLLATKKGKIVAALTLLILLIAIILAIPFTRHHVLGWLVKKDISITVLDSVTHKPVLDAQVTVDNVSAKTGKDGVVILPKIAIGDYDVRVTKQYYASYTKRYSVPLFSNPKNEKINVKATGRQIEVSVNDTISGEPVKDAVVTVSNTTASTNEKGVATVVLPADKNVLKGTVTKNGYDEVDIKVTNSTDSSSKNKFDLTQRGSLIYLSKATGVINVMKANLDGKGAKSIVAGTGTENDATTVLLSARDWKYSALQAQREATKERLYLVDSVKGDFSIIDEGDASFQLIGWSGHNFIYIVNRKVTNLWDDKRQAVKSFNAETRTIKTLAVTVGGGSNSYNYLYEIIGDVYIMDGEIVYAKQWTYGSQYQYQDPAKNISLVSINPATGAKQIVKEFPQGYNDSIAAKLYEPQGLYLRLYKNTSQAATYYEYEDKAIKTVTNTTDDKFYGFYATFLVSPSGKKTLWYEPRDGKNVIFIGDSSGKNGKQIATLSDFVPYGWYGDSDEYILLSKNRSELYIAAAGKTISKDSYEPRKITDYHKPQLSYAGYGYGYGGQ